MVAVGAALASAFLYAVASVLQQRSAAREPEEHSLRVRLLGRLLRRPVWLAGLAADFAAFGLQVVALHRGSLVLVQPLLVSGLVFALPLGSAVSGRRVARRDWIGGVAVVAGVGLLLVVADPAHGRSDASGAVWLVLAVATLGPVAALVVLARRAPRSRRAWLLAAAAGLLYALTAALTKTSAELVGEGVGRAVTAWQPYALVVLAVAGMVVVQSAFQAAPLAASLPMLTVADPVASMAIGALAFGESVTTAGAAPLLEVVGLVAMSAGVVILVRSPLVALDP